MSEQFTNNADNNADEKALPSVTVDKKDRTDGMARLAVTTGNLLEQADAIVYAIVGICFILGALLALGYTFWSFSNSVNDILTLNPADSKLAPGMFASTIISLVSDLLLVLIIMEVLSTIIQYLKAHVTSLTPFLAIGIISATRGVLSIGARLSVGDVQGENFNHAMLELGVNAGAILALGITLTLLSRATQGNSTRPI